MKASAIQILLLGFQWFLVEPVVWSGQNLMICFFRIAEKTKGDSNAIAIKKNVAMCSNPR